MNEERRTPTIGTISKQTKAAEAWGSTNHRQEPYDPTQTAIRRSQQTTARASASAGLPAPARLPACRLASACEEGEGEGEAGERSRRGGGRLLTDAVNSRGSLRKLVNPHPTLEGGASLGGRSLARSPAALRHPSTRRDRLAASDRPPAGLEGERTKLEAHETDRVDLLGDETDDDERHREGGSGVRKAERNGARRIDGRC